ncbi:MAG: TspO/MBR family protein [Parachlamydiaceae bacterium]
MKVFILVCSISACLILGMLGGVFTESSVRTWYPGLVKPNLTPPNWVFPVVWSVLYTLMGISIWLIWQTEANRKKRKAYQLFVLQFALNFGWSILFFYLKSPMLGLLDLITLIILSLWMVKAFLNISPTAAYLQLPYLAWLFYAGYLNLMILIFNR